MPMSRSPYLPPVLDHYRVLLVLLLSCTLAPAEEGGLGVRVRTLVGELGSDDIAVRQEATRALVELGPDVEPLVQTYVDAVDPEVRCRVQEVLSALGRLKLVEPSAWIHLPAGEMDVLEALREVARQAHRPLDEGHVLLVDKRIALEARRLPLWEALDLLTAAGGCGFSWPIHERISLRSEPRRVPRSYSGPFILSVWEASHWRSVDLEQTRTEERRSLDLTLCWERHIRPNCIARKLSITSMCDDRGRTLSQCTDGVNTKWTTPYPDFGASEDRPRCTPYRVELGPDAEGAVRIETMRGTIPIAFFIGEAEVRFDLAHERDGTSKETPEVRVKLTTVESSQTTLRIGIDVTSPDPEVARLLHESDCVRFDVQGSDGSQQARRVRDESECQWSPGVPRTLRFEDVPTPCFLVVRMPSQFVIHEVPFEFKNIDLPVSAPDLATSEDHPAPQIDGPARLPDAVPSLERERLTGPSAWIRMPAGEVDVLDAFNEVARQSGRKLELGQLSLAGRRVRLDGRPMSLWEAIQRLAVAGDCTWSPYSLDKPEQLPLYPSRTPALPVVTSGAFRVYIRSVSRFRRIQYAEERREDSSSLDVCVNWEPHIRPLCVADRVRVLELADDRGACVPLDTDRGVDRWKEGMPRWGSTDRYSGHASWCVSVTPASTGSTKIRIFRGSVCVAFPEQLAEIAIPMTENQIGVSERIGDAHATLESLRREGKSVTATLRIDGLDESFSNMLAEVTSSRFGVCAIKVGNDPPKEEGLMSIDSCKGGYVFHATFDLAPESGGALVVRIPTRTLRHEIPFEFRDVEIP